MVTTRKQSGVVPKPTAKALTADEAYATASDEDDDGDFKASKKRKVSSSKRQKKSGNATASGSKAKAAAKPRRRGKDLSLLPTMPLDILYEILSQLTPKDLLNLSRTNKLFRSTMFGNQMLTVWRAARDAFDAPEPPDGWSEQKWAGLLFEKTCQSCGQRGVVNVDWLLLRRACGTCKRGHLIYGPRLKSRFPDYDPEMLEYVPHTHTSAWTKGWWSTRTNSKFYWDDDIEEVADVYECGYDEYWVEQRKELIAERMVKVYQDWREQMDKSNGNATAENREKRLEAVKARFREEGYENRDLEVITVYSDGIYTGTPHVTNAVWSRLRPKLEPKVQKKMNERIMADLKPSVDKRMAMLAGLYDAYLGKLRPSESCYCPPVDFLRVNPDVIKVVEADKAIDITEKDFQLIVEKFGEYVSQYQDDMEKVFLKLMPVDTEGVEDPLQLARVVLRRDRRTESEWYWYGSNNVDPEDNFLIGRDMVCTHTWAKRRKMELRPGVSVDMPSKYEFNSDVSKACSSVITVAGLPPATATIAEMDAKDARFVCKLCVSMNGYNVFTWRAAARHVWFGGNQNHSMRLATEEEEKMSKENELALREGAKAWSCNHCRAFLEPSASRTKPVVLEHLKSEHGITADEAKLDEDYYVNQRCRHAYEAPYQIPEPNAERLKCMCYNCRSGPLILHSKETISVHCVNRYPFKRFEDLISGADYEIIPRPSEGEKVVEASSFFGELAES
ncbi:hypothetical protein DFP72DRAFT_1076071 [Ephemerocybe angulata]|uniref:F-box domain-containing protein n=1 Tax=Ephemerocybe angulata TaxID=980116 RepID=A0A8H6LZG0_9AGAR|nr:hypothetical protein DFP72DRAFT_1076071 [Tulosesus angulatus]